MSWADFDKESALERDMLLRALPLVPTESSGGSRVKVDREAASTQVAVAMLDASGATPSSCVDLLRIRPLLVGAAWKVLDLLLEEAFLQAGETPDLTRGFSIDRKREHARACMGRPAPFRADLWTATTRTYDATAGLRDSLVHRQVFTDQSGALVGHDKGGGKLRPVHAREQEALGRAALRSSEIVVHQSTDARVEADLSNQLATLSALHHVALISAALPTDIAEITVLLDRDVDGAHHYPLDVPQLRTLQPYKGSEFADLIVEFRDRPGQVLRGRLENAPDRIVALEPDQPPDWLS